MTVPREEALQSNPLNIFCKYAENAEAGRDGSHPETTKSLVATATRLASPVQFLSDQLKALVFCKA